MTEQEYSQELRGIIDKIKTGDGKQFQEELMELYNYKPVRLLWHVAYGEWLVSQQNYFEAWNQVSMYYLEGKEYTGIKEFQELHRRILSHWKNTDDIEMINYRYGNQKIHIKMEKHLEQLFFNYIEDDSFENLEKLMLEYYKTENWLVFLLIKTKLREQGYFEKDDKSAWYYKQKNYDYLEQKLLYSKEDIVLVQDERCQKECDLIAGILNEFGHKVYLLAQPTVMETGMLHSEELAELCMENREEYGDTIVIPIIETISIEGKKENNRVEVLCYLYKNVIKRKFALLFTTGNVFDDLIEQPNLKKNIECLSEFNHIIREDKMYFGWVGDYQLYISDIYGFDVKERVNNKGSSCDFSIVVPARNSAGTLYYTLQTCLNQDYTGSYEVIVSDNSTNGNQEVYQVCQDLNDSRIKYVKTPRDLQLTKSFEFAFLQAKGEFIFSLGSDDGICPWALSTLSDVIKQYPNEEVIGWKRGYYCWKGYPGSKEDEFVIPGQYNKKEIKCYYMPQMDYFAKVLKYSFNMYNLPTMYVNSGFHRSYFNTLLEKTGRLWDGCNQDIYMGVISAAINKNVLNIDFPLTLVGISQNSLGYLVSKPQNKYNVDIEKQKLVESTRKGDNTGIYIINGIVKDMPVGAGEFFSLYANILRAIQLGVLPDSWRTELLDYKKIFTEFFEEHNCLDDNYDRYLHYARYVAEQRGEEFLKWFDETIYNDAVIPKYYRKRPDSDVKKKYYKEGIGMEGELVLDASKYGVTNIVEAVKLFEELIYWTPETYEEELEKRRIHD